MTSSTSLPPLRTLFFDDLKVGMTERLKKTIAASDVVGFAQLTGDRNPIHLSEHFAARTPFGRRIAHGLYTASLISAVLGTRLPGPGAIYIAQTLNFRAPVKIGDTVTVIVTVAELTPEKSRAGLTCVCKVGRAGGARRRGAGESAARGKGQAAADAVVGGEAALPLISLRAGEARAWLTKILCLSAVEHSGRHRFRRHRVRCFDGTGGESWKGEGLRESLNLKRYG